MKQSPIYPLWNLLKDYEPAIDSGYVPDSSRKYPMITITFFDPEGDIYDSLIEDITRVLQISEDEDDPSVRFVDIPTMYLGNANARQLVKDFRKLMNQ